MLFFPFLNESSILNFTKNSWNNFAGFGKNSYYRLKNNPKINWRKFLFAVLKCSLTTISERKNRF